MNYRYSLDSWQAKFFAGLNKGETMVIVVPLKEQPPEPDNALNTARFLSACILPYPAGARVGLRETWRIASFYSDNAILTIQYKSGGMLFLSKKEHGDIVYRYGFLPHTKWRSASCMPVDAIRYWVIAKDPRVDRVQNVNVGETLMMGYKPDIELGYGTVGNFIENWFNARYAPKWTWEMNVYVEILTVEKE